MTALHDSLASSTLSVALAAAIRAACTARGDPAENAAALLSECQALDAAGQLDMLEHFRAEAQRFGASNQQEVGLP